MTLSLRCSAASVVATPIHIYMLRALDDTMARLPQRVGADVCIDDVATSVGESAVEAIREAAETRGLMSEDFTKRLGCTFASG